MREYESGIYLSPADSQECDELEMKMKLIDEKLNHYRTQRKRAATRIQMIKRHKNLKDDIVKTIRSNIVYNLPSGVLEEILKTSAINGDGISAMLHRLSTAK